MRLRFGVIAALSCLVVACGSQDEEQAETSSAADETSGDEQPAAARSGGMQIEGTLGTIPQRRIDEAMEAKLPAFQRCFFNGSADVEFLGGRFEFYVRVAQDGSVEYVYPRASSIGHRGTELCLLGILGKARFPKPQGGTGAEFAWDFEIDPAGGVRAPVAWREDRVVTEVLKQRGSLDACELDGGRFTVTAYVAPGGALTGVGAAADSNDAATKIDCIVEAVRAWQLPDPGSYAAKVSFGL